MTQKIAPWCGALGNIPQRVLRGGRRSEMRTRGRRRAQCARHRELRCRLRHPGHLASPVGTPTQVSGWADGNFGDGRKLRACGAIESRSSR